jgi:hypothetical protein
MIAQFQHPTGNSPIATDYFNRFPHLPHLLVVLDLPLEPFKRFQLREQPVRLPDVRRLLQVGLPRQYRLLKLLYVRRLQYLRLQAERVVLLGPVLRLYLLPEEGGAFWNDVI